MMANVTKKITILAAALFALTLAFFITCPAHAEAKEDARTTVEISRVEEVDDGYDAEASDVEYLIAIPGAF